MGVKKKMLLLAVIIFTTVMFSGSVLAADKFNIIVGEWQRTDGNYLIRVSDVQADGQARIQYFNPRPIHVEEAAISTQKGLIKLFVRFQDKGYEGSTYDLYYYAEKDALVGFYHQAVMDRTYEVFFLRKPDKTNQDFHRNKL